MPARIIPTSDPAFDEIAPPGFRELIEQANRFVAPNRLRRYQADIIATGELTWPDPQSGQLTPCAGTLCFYTNAFAWRFCGPAGAFWLTSGDPSFGFELVGLLMPGGQDFLRFDSTNQTLAADAQRDAIAQCEAALGSSPPEPGPLPARMVVASGNFAHFIWNELPALIEAETIPKPAVACWTSAEPVAPLERLVRWAQPVPVQRVTGHDLFGGSPPFHKAILFTPGSTQVSLIAKARVMEACGPIPHAPPGRFVVWLSLRLKQRYPVNQVPVFALFIEAIARLPFAAEVILDGFSLRNDIDQREPHVGIADRAHAAAVTTLAAELLAAVPTAARERVVINDATAATLPQSIALAARAHFYVCHHGSQQHKIGWLYSTPGIIHAPPAVVRLNPAHWAQLQSEEAALPEYVPEPLVAALPDAGTNPYTANYVFADPQGTVDFILARMRAAAQAQGFAGPA